MNIHDVFPKISEAPEDDEHDLAAVDVDVFEQHIRNQDRRRRRLTAVAVALALAGASAFASVAVVMRPRSRYPGGDDGSPPSSYMASTSSIPKVDDAWAAPPRPVPTAPHPSKLPMCREPTPPLAWRSMCQLDAPAASAIFECERPEVGLVWPRAVSWRCPPVVPRPARSTAIELMFDREGEMPKHGELVVDGDPRLAPRGVVRKVTATLRELDRAAAAEQVDLLLAAARGWGCLKLEETRNFGIWYEIDCGERWKIRVHYSDLGTSSSVTIEAASPPGFELTDLHAAPLPPAGRPDASP
jgi:hypothetical protein